MKNLFIDLGYLNVKHNVIYTRKNRKRQIDVEFYEPGLLKRKSICECKYRQNGPFDLEDTLAQLLSARRFVKADNLYLATNFPIRERDYIYKQTRVIVYDSTILQELDKIRGGNKTQSLEQKIARV